MSNSQYNIDYGVVKKPQHDRELTPEESDEWVQCAIDPMYFFTNYCHVVLEGKGMIVFEPRDYQRDVLNVILNSRFNCINAPRQVGKRLGMDTIVPTPHGYTTVGDIAVGDQIIGADGKATAVTYLSPIEQKADSYKVTFSTGEEFLADAEHLWTVNERDYFGTEVKHTLNTKNILDGGLTDELGHRFSIDAVKPLSVGGWHKGSDVDPYTLGLKLKDAVGIPLTYLRAGSDTRFSLFEGIMAGMGTHAGNGEVRVSHESKRMIEDIHELVASLGCCFHVPVYCDGQYHITGSLLDTRRDIVSIEKVDDVPMRCIQVDNEDHLFCIGRSFVPTHNTTLMALYCLHQTIFKENFSAGVTSYTLNGCKDILGRVKFTYENLPDFIKPPVTLYNRSEIVFTNGSAIFTQVTNDQTFRGKSLDLALVDEFAFCSPLTADEFYTSFLPALTARGEESTTKVIFISTPNGSSGKYAEIAFGAMAKENGFEYLKVDHTKIPGRTEEFRQSMMAKLGKNKYMQEYEGAFLSDKGTLINSNTIENTKAIDPVRSIGDLDIFVDSFQGRTIAFACDISEGIGKDNHAIQFLDANTFEQVAEFANNTMNQSQYFREIVKIIHFLYNSGAVEVYYTVENNGLGNGVIRLIENSQDDKLNDAMIINDVNEQGIPTGRTGLYTTNKTKLAGCTQLKDLMESDKLKINSAKLLNEMRFFVKRGSSFAAEAGAKDDRVMAMVILMNLMTQLANYEDAVYDTMNDINVFGNDEEDWGIMF